MAAGRRRTAILISGRGSNMAALLDATRSPDYPAEVVLVVASTASAPGLTIASDAGIETTVVEPGKGKEDRPKAEALLDKTLDAAGVEIICLAGYMHLLSADFVSRRAGRIINIHPSLLPAFRGLDTHARALAAGVRIHGCTAHFVAAEVDAGPIIAQAAVPVLSCDTPETLAARVLRVEHVLYPRALALVADGAVSVSDGLVTGEEPPASATAFLASPPLD